MTDARIVVRDTPTPALGIVYREFGVHSTAWFDSMRRFLTGLPDRVVRLGYNDVEEHVGRLASRLRSTLGERLTDAAFVGIPRGGLIVLGMLAYELGLRHDQIVGIGSASDLEVIVDDCAYSGARVGEYLSVSRADKIVFACLLAPPPLLKAIEHSEQRVLSSIAAAEMKDLTPQGARGERWQAGWANLLAADRRYWVGLTEHVCLPWAEPDWSFWDDDAQQVQDGWTVLPPEICIEHRHEPTQRSVAVEIQNWGVGPIHPGDDVLYARTDDEVVLTNLVDGRQFVLEGTGADVWKGLVANGEIDATVRAMLETYEVDPSSLHTDVSEFADRLAKARLIQGFRGGAG